MKARKTVLRVCRKMVLMVLSTLVGTTPGTLSAGINEWTSLGPEGGPIQALSIDPHHPATIYAATGYVHVFKSVNWGASWMNSGAPNGVLIFDPQNPGADIRGKRLPRSRN